VSLWLLLPHERPSILCYREEHGEKREGEKGKGVKSGMRNEGRKDTPSGTREKRMQPAVKSIDFFSVPLFLMALSLLFDPSSCESIH
jgi:hypothetical protein